MNDYRVLVTGGAGGIGFAIANALLERGAAVILVNRDTTALASAKQRLARYGDRVDTFACDVTQPRDRQALVDFARHWRGGVNVLINNAGVSGFALLSDQSAAQIERTIAVNIAAPILLCHALLPTLQEQPNAHIVNIGSVYGSIGFAAHSVYSASKFALRGFSEALRRELADSTVKVHCLAPRATRTALNHGAGESLNRALGSKTDEPQVVGEAVCRMLTRGTGFAVIGWPEKFFARLNALLPQVVDKALRSKLPTIVQHARDVSATH
jgi:short-subunit dehydrogenase